jgi:hypothetical protein
MKGCRCAGAFAPVQAHKESETLRSLGNGGSGDEGRDLPSGSGSYEAADRQTTREEIAQRRQEVKFAVAFESPWLVQVG